MEVDNMSKKLFFIALSLWVFVAFIEVFVFSRTFTSCPTNLDSIYGDAGVSLIPLGYTCTWDSFPQGVVVKSYPPLSTLLTPLVLLLWGFSLFEKKKK